MGNGMMQGEGLMGMEGMFFGPWSMLAYGALVILALVVLVRLFSRRGTSDGGSLDILKQRFAAGEISADEFKSMKREIRA